MGAMDAEPTKGGLQSSKTVELGGKTIELILLDDQVCTVASAPSPLHPVATHRPDDTGPPPPPI